MRRGNNIRGEEGKKNYGIRPFPLWGMIFCGAILISIGIYAYLEKEFIVGKSYGGKLGKVGTPIVLNWQGLVLIGLAICSLPTYQLIKQRKKKIG